MWTIETFHLEFVSQTPTTYVHFPRPNCYGKSDTPNLGKTITDRFENLRARPRQKYLHRGKILSQSETAKTQLIFDSRVRSGTFNPSQALTLIPLARNFTGMQI
jgi:hypothetical protein